MQDTSLVTPSIDMTSLTSPVVGFKQDYRNLGDFTDVDVSIDGGATWTTVLHQEDDARGPREEVLQLPSAAGQADVKIRFHQYESDFDWWWQIDDVSIANRSCDPIPGGLVVGTVRSAVTKNGINGATVTSLDKPDETATTRATPDDTKLSDGFYWMFSTITGSHRFEAAANQHASQTKRATVDADDATRVNFQLASGHLTVTPTSLTGTRVLGGAPIARTFTLTNDGTLPVNVELGEQDGGFVMLGADGSRTNTAKLATEHGAPLQTLKVPTSLSATGTPGKSADAGSQVGPADAPWADIADYPDVVMDNRVVYVDGIAYSLGGGDGTASYDSVFAYDPAALAWSEKASMPGARNAVNTGAVGGQIVVSGGWADGGPDVSTWVYNPSADAWADAADAPEALSASGTAVADGKLYVVGGCTTADCLPMSSAVSAYDPAADSWTELADYPSAVAFAVCGGIDGKVYCTGGNDGGGGTADSYVYDPGADTWSPIAEATADTWAANAAVANGTLIVNGGVQGAGVTNRSFAYDPATDSWSDLPNSNTAVYRGGDGVRPVQGRRLVGWLHADGRQRDAARLRGLRLVRGRRRLADREPDHRHAGARPVPHGPRDHGPGRRPARHVRRLDRDHDDAPGSVDAVDVTLTVTPPAAWGKLVGTVSGQSCTGADQPAGQGHGAGGLLGGLVDVRHERRGRVRLLVQQRRQPADADRGEGRVPAEDEDRPHPEGGDGDGRLHPAETGVLTA